MTEREKGMFDKLKEQLSEQRERRMEKRSKPWSKKQKIVFISVFAAALIYVAVSVIVSGSENGLKLPRLNLSVSGIDIILLVLLGIGFAIFKIRSYIKRRKGNGK